MLFEAADEELMTVLAEFVLVGRAAVETREPIVVPGLVAAEDCGLMILLVVFVKDETGRSCCCC